jgi:hypothetical protein
MSAFRDIADEVREAMNKSPHVCARARVGERPVSWLVFAAEIRARPDRAVRMKPSHSDVGVRDAKNNEVRDATKKKRHACARAQGGERPVS